MVSQEIQDAVRRYLVAVRRKGIHATQAVVFGSHAHGAADADSDIDLIVIAPEFDGPPDLVLIKRLWGATTADSRIEPIACGEREWKSGNGRPILEIARREGVVIAAAPRGK